MIIKKLSELADIILGYPFESNKFNLEGRGVCLVRGMNVTERNLRFGEDARYWDELTPELEPYYLKENDILIGMDGSKVGKNFAVVQKEHLPLLLVQRVACIRAKNGVYQPFLWFAIASTNFTDYINTVKTGSSIPHISGKQIGDFRIQIPSYDEQKIIADRLWVIESKIRNNNAICAELEAMAKLLYDYWFVQFDFPDENGKPYKSSGGKMVWNEELKREIPKGWEIRTISDLGIYVSDYTANGSFAGLAENVKYNEGIPYAILVRSVDFSNGFSPSKYIWINEHGYEYLKTCHLTGGEIIIINVGAVGDTYRVPCLNVNMVLGPNGLVIKSKNLDNYLYCFLRSDYGKTTIDNMASGSVQRKFNKTDFRNMKILVPPKQLLNQFEMMYTPISDYVSNLWLENRDLASLRDFLLPLLMNGQVGFKEVDCH